jgi:hypothetical protein
MPSAPSTSSTARRLLHRLTLASRGDSTVIARASLGAALGVALVCATPALAQSPRSVLGVASCPPPAGEKRCHPGGDTKLLWVYDTGNLHESGWGGPGGTWISFFGQNRVISPKNPQIVQVHFSYPEDAPVCPATWSTQQPPCHPGCEISEFGFLSCEQHLVQFVPQAYRQLSACPPPPGENRCAIQGLPGWIKIHPEPTPPDIEGDNSPPSGRFGTGPIWYKAPGSSKRELAGSLELSIGYFNSLRSRSNPDFGLSFPIELGYAHDWGSGYGGHAFLAGVGAGVTFGDQRWQSVTYFPHLSLGSRGGFTPGIRHGLRYSLGYVVNVELQHQYLSTPAGSSNHVGVLFGLDLFAMLAILASGAHGRPLLVESDSRIAPLTTSPAWA